MARKRPGFYETIEYIGPRPQKRPARRQHGLGGWFIVVLAIGVAAWFGRPLVPFLKATQQGVSTEQAVLLIAALAETGKPGDELAAAAIGHSREPVVYDNSYYNISYPNGDIAPGKGNAADVVIRCFRRVGIDLQQAVHEDMAEHFRAYPQLWDALAPDRNIDHRRVANLARFFERKGDVLPVTREPSDYKPGDIVVWSLATAEEHIGIVVPGPGVTENEPWVVHHLGQNLQWSDSLFDFKIIGRYRYPAASSH